MSDEPIDVLDGSVLPEREPFLSDKERRAVALEQPPTAVVVEALEAGVKAAKAAVIPDQKPERLPGVKRTLGEVKDLKRRKQELIPERSPPPTPLTPITPRSPGNFFPEIDAEALVTKTPEIGPNQEIPPVEDDGSAPESHVAKALEIAKPFNRQRAAMVLLDAFAMGDEAAAVKWNVKKGTVTGYRERLTTDPEFAKIVSLRYAELERSWSVARLQCLRSVIKRIEVLAQTSEDIYRLAGAVKVLGELQVVAGVLNGGPEDPNQGVSAQKTEGRATRGPGPVFERLDK